MKTKLLALMLLMAFPFIVSSCSKDDSNDFNYPMETLYGTWEGIGIYYDGEWIDPTSNQLYEDLKFSITFYKDGKYYGKGFFGTGNGTYKTKGNTITTYVDGKIYLTYEVKSFNTTNAEVTMFDNSGDSMQLRLRKKQYAKTCIID